MKKILFIFVTLLSLLAMTLGIAACGGEEKTETQTYSITCQTSDEYTLQASKASAEAGESISVTVTVKSEDKYLTGVQYNGEECTKEGDGFVFTMPAENVTLTAVLGNYTQTTENGIAKLEDEATAVIVNGTYPGGILDTKTWKISVGLDASYMTMLNASYESSNEEVLPVGAISTENVQASGSNVIVGAKIVIDTTKIKAGVSWLTATFKSGNNSSQKGTLVLKITVSESVQVEYWNETLVFDVEDFGADTTFYVYVSDRNYIENDEVKQNQNFDELKAQDGKVTVTFRYAPGHSYWLEFGVNTADGVIWYDLSESVSGGSSDTGFNQYKDKLLSFIEPDYTLNITVLETTHS